MSTPANVTADLSPSEVVAGEVRAHLARRGMSLRAFEAELGVSALWAVRRVGPSRSIDLTLEDLSLIASALGLAPADLLAP